MACAPLHRETLAGLQRSRCRRLRRHIRRCSSWGDSPTRGRSLRTRRRRGCSRWRRCSRWRGCSRAIRHAHVGSAAAAVAETGATLGEGGSCGERERDSDRCEAFHGWCLSGCLTYGYRHAAPPCFRQCDAGRSSASRFLRHTEGMPTSGPRCGGRCGPGSPAQWPSSSFVTSRPGKQ
jgi:hypothetical protein